MLSLSRTRLPHLSLLVAIAFSAPLAEPVKSHNYSTKVLTPQQVKVLTRHLAYPQSVDALVDRVGSPTSVRQGWGGFTWYYQLPGGEPKMLAFRLSYRGGREVVESPTQTPSW